MVYNGISKVAQKTPQIFVCEKCDYTTSKKSSWSKHLETKKHLGGEKLLKVAKSCSTERIKCLCGKSYKFNSGYYRHKTNCSANEMENKLIEKITASLMNVFGNQTVINNTINNQKIFNVNLYLNEHCANAMSIQEFAKRLQLTMEDLDKDKPDCLTNVVLKNLKPMDISNRPFHCTDISSSEWYIKDIDNGWESDTGEKVLRTTEHAINQKWSVEFEKQHPSWVDDEKQQEAYVKLAGNAASLLTSKSTLKVLKDISMCAQL